MRLPRMLSVRDEPQSKIKRTVTVVESRRLKTVHIGPLARDRAVPIFRSLPFKRVLVFILNLTVTVRFKYGAHK